MRAVLHGQVGDALDGIGDDDELREHLADRYDSLAAMEFVASVEAEFGIEVDFVAHDVRHIFVTIARIARFVRDQLEDRAVLGGGA
ncbi:MAG: acyl carrier protein [Geodermatophilaceae bacterium]